MSRIISEYWNEKSGIDGGYLMQSMPVLIASSKNQLLEYMLKMDGNYFYTITLTYKVTSADCNDSIARATQSWFSQNVKSFYYYLLPAYQDRGVLHYHGLLWYNLRNKKRPAIGLTAKKLLTAELNKRFGWCTIKHMRSSTKAKIFDIKHELNKVIEYHYSEDNYGGMNKYPPISSFPKTI